MNTRAGVNSRDLLYLEESLGVLHELDLGRVRRRAVEHVVVGRDLLERQVTRATNLYAVSLIRQKVNAATYASQKEDLEHQQAHGNSSGLEALVNAQLIGEFVRFFDHEQFGESVADPEHVSIKLFEQKCLGDLMPLIFFLHSQQWQEITEGRDDVLVTTFFGGDESIDNAQDVVVQLGIALNERDQQTVERTIAFEGLVGG